MNNEIMPNVFCTAFKFLDNSIFFHPHFYTRYHSLRDVIIRTKAYPMYIERER